MLYTLILGAPARNRERELGTIGRVIANNGVVNQFTVNPSGLFSGPERIVPISDVAEATEEHVLLTTDDIEWNAYAAFSAERLIVSDQAAAPNLIQQAPRAELTSEMVDVPTAEAGSSERTVSGMAVVLTTDTRVGDDQRLAGLVVDMGIPQQILLQGGGSIPYAHVARLGEDRIVLGEPTPRLDNVTPPGILGDAPGRVDRSLKPGALGDPEPGPEGPARPAGRD